MRVVVTRVGIKSRYTGDVRPHRHQDFELQLKLVCGEYMSYLKSTMLLLLFLSISQEYKFYSFTSSSAASSIRWAALSPDGSIVANCMSNGDLIIYGQAGYAFTLSQTITTANAFNFAAFSDDNSVLVTLQNNGRFSSYSQSTASPPTYSLAYSYTITNQPNDVCIAGDASYVFVGDLQSFHYFTYTGSGAVYNYGGVVSVGFGSASSVLNSCSFYSGTLAWSYRDRLVIYSVPTFTITQTINPAGGFIFQSVRLSPDLSKIILGGDRVLIYSLSAGSYSLSYTDSSTSNVYSVAIAQDNSIAIAATTTPGNFLIYTFTGGTVSSLATWNQPTSVNSIQLSTDNNMIVSGGSDGRFRLYVKVCANGKPYALSTSCVTSCPTYYIATTSALCQYCSSNILGSSCLATCPTGNYPDTTRVCQPCTSPCLNCVTIATTCTSCVLGHFLSSSTCLGCGSYCNICASLTSCATCASTYWLQIVSYTCGIDCPIGQFKPAVFGTCSMCSLTCNDCNATDCFLCAVGYYMDPSNVCYSCLCSDCSSSCSGTVNCPTSLYQLDVRCYGNCPALYFQGPTLKCDLCVYPCKKCHNQTSCITCQQNLYLLDDHCHEECPDLYYASGLNCLYCFVNNTYINTPPCQKYIPEIAGRTDDPSPFTSNKLTLKFKSARKLNIATVTKANLFLSFKVGAQDVSSCFDYSVANANADYFQLVVVNKGCSVSGLEIELTSNGQLKQLLGMPVVIKDTKFKWELTAPQLSVNPAVIFTQQFWVAFKYMRLANSLPILMLLFPSLRMNVLLLFLNVHYPYQCHNLVSLVSSSTFSVNHYGFASPEWSVFGAKTGQNVNELPLGAAAFSGNFLIDSHIALIWIVASWTAIGLSCIINSLGDYRVTLNNFQFRVHQAVSLQLVGSAAATVRNLSLERGAVDIAAIVALVLTSGYWFYYLFRSINSVYVLNEISDIDQRLKAVKNSSGTMQLKWQLEDNSLAGSKQGLNPLYHKALLLFVDSLLYFVFIAASLSAPVQLILVIGYSIFCLLKVVFISPFEMPVLSWIVGARQAALICFSGLSIYADSVYKGLIRFTKNRMLVGQQSIDLWLLIGWPLFALYLLILVCGIVFEIVGFFCKKDYSEAMFKSCNQSISNLTEDRQLKQQNVLLNLNRKDDKMVMQQQVETLKVLFQTETVGIKINTVVDLKYSLQKTYLSENGVALTKGRIYQSYMNIGPSEQLYFNLNRLKENFCPNASQFTVKTFAVIDTSKLLMNEPIAPTNFYNLLVFLNQNYEQTLEFKGSKALSFLPVCKSAGLQNMLK